MKTYFTKVCFQANYRVNRHVLKINNRSSESPGPSQGHTYMAQSFQGFQGQLGPSGPNHFSQAGLQTVYVMFKKEVFSLQSY